MSSQMRIKIVEEMNDEYLSDLINGANTVSVKPGISAISTLRLEALIKIATLQK